jgi:AraC-like DNA-binding protein
MITIISTLNIGFSVVIALLLFICYLFFLKSNNKSNKSVISTGLFLFGLTALQLEHLNFVLNDTDPLNTLYYRVLLFLVPPMFYFFSRFVLFPGYQLKFYSAVHFLPASIAFFVARDIAVPIAFIIGTGYCVWLSHIIYGLRNHRKRFEIEFFFFAFFSLLAIAVLIFGFSASFIDNAYFYHFYANGLAFAYILVTAALIIYPDLLNEITEAVKLGYSTSTLTNVDIDKQTDQLKEMMEHSKMYQNENLSLSLLAEAMDLTAHQLSELINTHYCVSFSQYIREVRVGHAKHLLINEPNSSVLSISMETGFKSQSNFYAAFKNLTGQSPGNYRKSHK